ncbi:MAG: iron-sulfur cluster assembly scaffold protein [Deltaproteobacteria bacterium HGW-Deltaproteobacteria-11]|nr:MAG: iron-sulfur cluster assembly scaffold protein [Deltaproteobacteria bacterium HGW-Deltaproteobacteria-11]
MKESENATQKSRGMFFSERTLDYGMNPAYYGDMDRPDGHARITGPCGDTVDIYLRIRKGKIEEAKFTTDGCLYSVAACNAAAHLATGKTLHQCLGDQCSIIEHLNGLPDDHAHCALLAATTLNKAVNDYVLKNKTPPATTPNPTKSLSKVGERHSRPSRQKIKDQILL